MQLSMLYWRRIRTSSRNVRNQLHFKQSDMVFQLQFPFLQSPQLQFLVISLLRKRFDDQIKISVLQFQFDDALANSFFRIHVS